MEEDRLFYPGSTLIAERARPGERNIDGRLSATSGHRLGTQDAAADVEAWYDRELAARGWLPSQSTSGIRSTAESTARAWERDGIVLRFAVRSRNSRSLPPEQLTGFATVYEVTLIGDP